MRASHSTVDLQWLSAATSLQPYLLQLSGAKYTGHGGIVRTHSKSLWIVRFDGDDNLAVLIDRALTTIERHRDKFEDFGNQGGRVDLFAGLFPDGQIGFTLNSSILKRLAAIGVEFHCTAYGWDRADDYPDGERR